jgi:hypothetical protein
MLQGPQTHADRSAPVGAHCRLPPRLDEALHTFLEQLRSRLTRSQKSCSSLRAILLARRYRHPKKTPTRAERSCRGRAAALLDLTAPPTEAARQLWNGRGVPVPVTGLDLLDTLLDAVNSAAAAYGPRLEAVHPTLEGRGFAFGRPVPRILTSLCLQLLEFVAEGVPARRCANATCGRYFTRQRGRARFGQSRSSGVLYCSALMCPRASSARVPPPEPPPLRHRR